MRLTLLLLLLPLLRSALAQDVNAPLRGRVLSSTDGVESPLGVGLAASATAASGNYTAGRAGVTEVGVAAATTATAWY